MQAISRRTLKAFFEWMLNQRQGKGGDGVRIGGMTTMLKIVSTRCLEKCVREAQQMMGRLGHAKGGKGGRFVPLSENVVAADCCVVLKPSQGTGRLWLSVRPPIPSLVY
jgi:hypothetical protein